MSAPHGSFVWYELMTTDPVAASAFYQGLLGWSAREAGVDGKSYTVMSAGEAGVGGVMAMPPEAAAAGARSAWRGYIAVDDVDASAARVVAAGGWQYLAPTDLPGIGRFAVVADPQRAAFTLFKPIPSAAGGAAAPAMMGGPGQVGWRELHAMDGASAFEFYADQFGWTKDTAVDMGGMGVYQLFAIDGAPSGGMMAKMAATPAPFWLYYFNVADINDSAASVARLGGSVVNGPVEVPGGAWVAQCLDPQGVMFALVQPPTECEA